jgi:hypothetical protein
MQCGNFRDQKLDYIFCYKQNKFMALNTDYKCHVDIEENITIKRVLLLLILSFAVLGN